LQKLQYSECAKEETIYSLKNIPLGSWQLSSWQPINGIFFCYSWVLAISSDAFVNIEKRNKETQSKYAHSQRPSMSGICRERTTALHTTLYWITVTQQMKVLVQPIFMAEYGAPPIGNLLTVVTTLIKHTRRKCYYAQQKKHC
jgi:hypothetical protein